MSIATTIGNASIRFYELSQKIMPFLLAGICLYLLMSGESHAATNYLKDLKDDVGATFGRGSDIEYYLYLAEGVMAGTAYIKTKNVMVLAGLPILMVFTHWALK